MKNNRYKINAKFFLLHINIGFVALFSFCVLFNIRVVAHDTTGLHQYVSELSKAKYLHPDSVASLLDSVKNLFDDEKTSAEMIRVYGILAGLYSVLQQPEKAQKLLSQQRKLITFTHNDTALLKYYYVKGVVFINRWQIDSANYYLNKAYTLANKLHDTLMNSTVSFYLGTVQNYMGNYDTAISLFFSAETYFKKVHNYVLLMHLYNSLGTLFINLGEVKKAIYYLDKARHYDRLVPERNYLIKILNNFGQAYFAADKYDSALIYYNKILASSSSKKNSYSYYSALVNIGNIYFISNKYKKALDAYRKVYQSSLYKNNEYVKTAVTINLGNVYVFLKQYDSASAMIKRGVKLAKLNKLMDFEANAYAVFYQMDSAQERWKDAFINLNKYYVLKMGLSNKETREHIEKLRSINELKYNKIETRALEKENLFKQKLIEKQNRLIYIESAFILFFVVLIIVFVISRLKIKKLHKELQIKNRLIEARNKDILQKNNELQKMNQMKDRFFSIIGHDLRSPYNSLLGILDLLESPAYEFSEQEQKELIGVIAKTVREEFNLLDNLLQWSLTQRGKITCITETFTLFEIAKKACGLYAINTEQKSIKLINNIPEHLEVWADLRLTSNIINNLVNNAVKFTSEGGTIKISARKNGDWVEVCIEDNGSGIPADKISNLFNIDNEYRQLGTANEKGTGLGLIMCKEFVQLMGGKIYLESTQDIGSRFYFTLPSEKPD